MMHTLSKAHIDRFVSYLDSEERAGSTVKKYGRDLLEFYLFLSESRRVDKNAVLCWKEELMQQYSVSTINTKIAALNGLFIFLGWQECCAKPLRQQRRIFRDKDREMNRAEYYRLLNAAKRGNNKRMYYLMETLGSTGIRISELQFITVESLETGKAAVNCKGKLRTVLLTQKLRNALKKYCLEQQIATGSIFVTRTGRPMDRSNIWRELQRLCKFANVDAHKVFPHNFRHLFAVSFYSLEKDIAKLADLLGHASIDTTRIYIMESGAEHERQVERLGLVI